MIKINDKLKTSLKLNDIMTKYHEDYIRYLGYNLSYSHDFLGNEWIEKQNEYICLGKFDEICSLFKILFNCGFYYEKFNSHNQKSFIFGVNQILDLINKENLSYYNNTYDNNRFFVSPYSNDFEGIWSELILFDYLKELGLDIYPYYDQANNEKKTPDFHIRGKNLDIEVKCFTDSKYYNGIISNSASLKPTTTELRNILRRFRKSEEKYSRDRTLITIIDVSLYYELFSEVVGSIILESSQLRNEFCKHLRRLEENSGHISPVYFQLRAPSTRLLSCLYPIGKYL